MGEGLRIVQLTPYYDPSIGGVESVVRYLSEELVLRGHSVDVFAANRMHPGHPPPQRAKHELMNGVRVRRFADLIRCGHMSLCPGEIPALWTGGYDLFHAHVYRHPHVTLAAVLARWKNVPVVLHGHCPFASDEFLRSPKRIAYRLHDRWIGGKLLRGMQAVIALTRFERERYLAMGADPQRVHVLPNAASDDCFDKTDSGPFLRKHGLYGRRIILFMGTLSDVKRPDLLVRALPRVVRNVPQALLLLVGPDSGIYGRLESQAQALGVSSYMRWVGPLYGAEKQQAYEACELLSLPSDWESFGLVIMEAMAHGKPVVGSDAIGPSCLIEPGETGLLVPRGDAEALAEALLNLLTRPQMCNRMGRRAAEVAGRQYRVRAVVDRLEEIYRDLLPGTSARSSLRSQAVKKELQ